MTTINMAPMSRLWCFSTIEIDGYRHVEAIMQPDGDYHPRARVMLRDSGYTTAPQGGIPLVDTELVIEAGCFTCFRLPAAGKELWVSEAVPMTAAWLDAAARRGRATVMLVPPGTWQDLPEGDLHLELGDEEQMRDLNMNHVVRAMGSGAVLWGLSKVALS